MNRRKAPALVSLVALALAAAIAFPRYASAQTVVLQIRPRVGDTLAVRLDQQVEMTGVPDNCVASAAVSRQQEKDKATPRTCSEMTRHMTTRMEVFSRAIVRGSTSDATILLALTDSIRTSASAVAGRISAPTRVSTPRNPVEFRVSGDGGAQVTSTDASDELRAVFGQMPPMLSRKPVSVGERWVRQMPIPLSSRPGARGLVRATFQLDSLGKNGDVAYVSMRGTFSHDQGEGSDSEVMGSLAGTMQLDRRLAWITETKATIDVRSKVKAATGTPMTVKTRITQLLRAARTR